MRTMRKSTEREQARPGRPFTMRSRRPTGAEGLSGGPVGWQKLRDTVEAFKGQGHSAGGATVAERVMTPRRR